MFGELAGLVDANIHAPDLPGHGGRDGAGCDWADALEEVVGAIDAHRPEVVVGYSMGGRLLVAAAAASPHDFTAVFVSAGLGIASEAERIERRRADERLAARIELNGIAEFLEKWEADEQLGGHSALSAIRRANKASGLAASLRGMGQGAQPYLGATIAEIGRPTFWVAGALDPKYAAVAERAAATVPHARAVIVSGARHNVVADAPDAVANVVSEALASRRSV